MLTKTKRNEKCTNQRNKNNIWKKVLVVSSLKLLLVLVLGYLGTTLQGLLIIPRDDNEEGNARGGGGTAIYGLYGYVAVKGMVFKQFTLG